MLSFFAMNSQTVNLVAESKNNLCLLNHEVIQTPTYTAFKTEKISKALFTFDAYPEAVFIANNIGKLFIANNINALQTSEEVKNKLLTKIQKDGKDVNVFLTYKNLSRTILINPLMYAGIQRGKRVRKMKEEMSELDRIRREQTVSARASRATARNRKREGFNTLNLR
jgi:hypothetical protein